MMGSVLCVGGHFVGTILYFHVHVGFCTVNKPLYDAKTVPSA